MDTTLTVPPMPNSPEARFLAAAARVVNAHGGRPVAFERDGKIAFRYPDGTVTVGGERVSDAS